jgi:hypothetical protein
MRRLTAIWILAMLLTAAVADAKPGTRSEASVGTTKVTQVVNLIGGSPHHWIHVEDPNGAPAFCVTFRLERKNGGSWRGLGRGSDRLSRECCPREDESDDGCYRGPGNAFWDSFVYPRGKLKREFTEGKLRVRAIPSVGPSVTLRL